MNQKTPHLRLLAIAFALVVIVGLHFLLPITQALLVLFAGVLFAVLLDGIGSWLTRHTRMRKRPAITVAAVVVIALPVVMVWFTGPRIAGQVVELWGKLPEAGVTIRSSLSQWEWGRRLLASYPDIVDSYQADAGMVGRIAGVFSTTLGAVAAVLITIFIGVYVAIAPGLYVRGFVSLFPKHKRARIREVLKAIVVALRRWIAGRLASMLVVGVLTLIGLLIAGIPLALSLSIIAALLAFVPYIGPVLAAIPAMLVAVVDEPVNALWVVVIYTIVQLVENYVITPLIQHRAVSMAPALLISIQILMGVLYGGIGMLMATPLAVVAIIAIQMLYIGDVLGDRVTPLGGGCAR